MSYFKLGPLLRQRRVTLGYTQEALADGICAVNTLSRYENGERMPTKEHLELLLQRLGLSDAIFDAYLDEKTFRLHELKYQIRQAIMEGREADAAPLLKEYEQIADGNSTITRQFVLLYHTLLNNEMSAREKLVSYEDALKLTCLRYGSEDTIPFFSFEEIILFNNIALQQFLCGQKDQAIHTLYCVKRYYDEIVVNREESLRTQPMILYNLSKYLGNAGRIQECIDICNEGIQLAQNTGRSLVLCATLYNKACALAARDEPGDMEAAKHAALMARSAAFCMGRDDLQVYIDNFMEKHFHEPTA